MGSEMCIRDSPYEVNTAILNRVETRRPNAVMLRGRFCSARQDVSVAVCAFFAVLECVVERGEELEPSLDSDVMVPHYAYAFQSLVIGEICGTWCPNDSRKGV